MDKAMDSPAKKDLEIRRNARSDDVGRAGLEPAAKGL